MVVVVSSPGSIPIITINYTKYRVTALGQTSYCKCVSIIITP